MTREQNIESACRALVHGVEDAVLRFVDSGDVSLPADWKDLLLARMKRAREAIATPAASPSEMPEPTRHAPREGCPDCRRRGYLCVACQPASPSETGARGDVPFAAVGEPRCHCGCGCTLRSRFVTCNHCVSGEHKPKSKPIGPIAEPIDAPPSEPERMTEEEWQAALAGWEEGHPLAMEAVEAECRRARSEVVALKAELEADPRRRLAESVERIAKNCDLSEKLLARAERAEEKLAQFEAYGITVKSALDDRDALSAASEAASRAAEEATEAIIAAAQEWVRLHVSGIGSPNESDLEEMAEWIRDRALPIPPAPTPSETATPSGVEVDEIAAERDRLFGALINVREFVNGQIDAVEIARATPHQPEEELAKKE